MKMWFPRRGCLTKPSTTPIPSAPETASEMWKKPYKTWGGGGRGARWLLGGPMNPLLQLCPRRPGWKGAAWVRRCVWGRGSPAPRTGPLRSFPHHGCLGDTSQKKHR